jgi:hypothetical protein
MIKWWVKYCAPAWFCVISNAFHVAIIKARFTALGNFVLQLKVSSSKTMFLSILCILFGNSLIITILFFGQKV